MTKKKRELILVLFILVVATAGNVTQTFDLTKDTDTMIDGVNGGTNHLIIENGTAYFSEASCPDKVCVHQGRVSQNGELIVCLPNRVIAKVVAPE